MNFRAVGHVRGRHPDMRFVGTDSSNRIYVSPIRRDNMTKGLPVDTLYSNVHDQDRTGGSNKRERETR